MAAEIIVGDSFAGLTRAGGPSITRSSPAPYIDQCAVLGAIGVKSTGSLMTSSSSIDCVLLVKPMLPTDRSIRLPARTYKRWTGRPVLAACLRFYPGSRSRLHLSLPTRIAEEAKRCSFQPSFTSRTVSRTRAKYSFRASSSSVIRGRAMAEVAGVNFFPGARGFEGVSSPVTQLVFERSRFWG